MTNSPARPNLTEAQAREAIDLFCDRMADAPKPPPAKVQAEIRKNMTDGWIGNAPGARFHTHAMYYGLANYAGRGVVEDLARKSECPMECGASVILDGMLIRDLDGAPHDCDR